jgi:malonyl-CoA decarboxylase
LLKAHRSERALDRVAHFHLSNGARIERLNWAGDLSHNGIAQSAGIMVNYLYKLSDIEKNHEAYSSTVKITASAAVRKIARA